MTAGDDGFGLAAALRDAKALIAAGQDAEAERRLTGLVETAPMVALALRELAILALRRGERERSIALFRRALAVTPNDWVSQSNIGVALRGLRRFEEALAAYDAATAINPRAAQAWSNRGNTLLELDRHDEALASFDQAAALSPDTPEYHLGRARAFLTLSRFDEALEAADRANALRSGDSEIVVMRASALLALKRLDEALAAYDEALAIAPDHALALGGRARTLVDFYYASDTPPSLAEIDQAFERARKLDPASPELAYAHSLMLMRERRFEAGWAAYERRWDVIHFRNTSRGQVTPDILRRLSRDVAPDQLNGRSVLLVSEQGVGDDIMFASMIPDVQARAASVSLICETRLHRLFASSFPGLQLIPPQAEGGQVPECDLVMAIGGLGRTFRNRIEDFPGTPFLRPTPAATARWRDWLGPRQGLRVGVSWRGGMRTTEGDRRSMTLDTLRPLLLNPACEFVNLQYGDVAAELAAANAGLPRPIRAAPPADLSDFDDLAGLVANLDLIVSVQTALVHLSGALGAPCLTMIPRKPEWRYGADGEAMAWYRSVRLIRQGRDGAWEPVVARVAEEVARRAAG